VKKISASFLAFGLLVVSCQFLTSKKIPPPPATAAPNMTKWDDRAIFKDGLVQSAQPVLDKLDGASVFHLEFKIDDDLVHITGNEEVRYTNTEGVALNDVRLRLFPNILGGEMHVGNVEVDGKKVIPNYGLSDSLLILPFVKPLEAGQNVTLKMDFTVRVSESITSNYGVQAYYDHVLTLAHAYPMITVYDDEGWNAEIPPQFGDVTYADMSFFIVKVDAPKQVVLVGSGREVNRDENGSRQTVTYEAGPVRDFYLAASPEYEVFTKEMDGIKLRFYTRDNLQAGAEYMLDVATHAIQDFSTRYAPYPYTELDIVSTPTLALGIEYPGMIAIAERIVTPDSAYLEATVVHEVGHQWFYNLVGNDQLDDPWLDESLTQFVTLQYFSDEVGQAGYDGFHKDLENRWLSIDQAKIPIGLPVADYSQAEYSGIVYGRGGLFFEALRNQIGTDDFDALMKDYVATNSWDIATPEKLKALAEKHCGCDLTALFDEWVY
jgi:aminopeptidase N